MLQMLLAAGCPLKPPPRFSVTNPMDDSPLHLACFVGCASRARRALLPPPPHARSGSPPHTLPLSGTHALARRYGPAAVRALLSAGANPADINASGMCPLTMASNQGNWQELQVLLTERADLGETPPSPFEGAPACC